jgi:hypothetical protein
LPRERARIVPEKRNVIPFWITFGGHRDTPGVTVVNPSLLGQAAQRERPQDDFAAITCIADAEDGDALFRVEDGRRVGDFTLGDLIDANQGRPGVALGGEEDGVELKTLRAGVEDEDRLPGGE